jgi:AraC-like DNA-binding protein
MEQCAVYEPDMQAFGILDIQLLLRYLDTRVAIPELLEGSHIAPIQLTAPDAHVSLAQKLAVYSNALAITEEKDLGLNVGLQARFSDFGVLGYAVFSSNTLLDSLLMGFKYLKLAGPVLKKTMAVNEKTGYFRAEQLVDIEGLLPFCCEYWFAAIQSLCEEVMQHPFPSKVIRFPYPEPEYGYRYQEVFHCKVEFNSPQLEWEFDSECLYAPLPTANPVTLKMCLNSCDDLLKKISSPSNLREQVTQRFLENPGNYPSIEALSKQLGMSSRTLRRHLKTNGTSYQQILDHVRFHLAKHYLNSTQFSIEEISERIGFSDSANFRHAFRKWSGVAPRAYRKSVLSESPIE